MIRREKERSRIRAVQMETQSSVGYKDKGWSDESTNKRTMGSEEVGGSKD